MTKQCKANGLTISYEESGAGEPLILLMGLGAPGSKWAPHIAAYEKHFHVYALDNRGAGQSDKPVSYSYTIEEMARDTIGFMDAVGIESAHFNGISMGGAITQYLAVNYPERVRSIILITFGRLGQWMIFAQPFQETDETYMLDSELADMAAPYPMPGYAYKAQCNAILGFDILKELPKVKAPALVVGGDRDLFVPVEVTKAMCDAIPGAKLYMAQNGGHVQHWEQLEKYNQVTLDFLLAQLH